MKRRLFLAAGTAALAGCDAVYSTLAGRLSGGVPKRFAMPEGQAVDPDVFLLRRATFGCAPGDLDRLRAVGRAAWLDEQLHPERIDDAACELLVRRFESLRLSAGDLFEFKREVAEDEIARATLLRAAYSRRQVYEVLVEFWSDHFNVFQGKGDCAWLKTADDRDVVRRHALGRFRDLLRASALSPAMLVYLDGRSNHKAKPNENYARELLELHSLGVHGGYTQADVMEVARCLTGWDVKRGWFKGQVRFHPDRHDDGPKRVLGADIPPGGGEKDLDRVLDIVSRHPSTARYVATKLVRRFVADEPPRALVDRVSARFTATDGDLRETAREVLQAVEPGPARFKRPFRFVVSALRGLAATTQGKRPVRRYLERMGQAPFQYPTPDGYPDEPEPWLGTLLWRWTFGLELAQGRVGDVKLGLPLEPREDLFAHLVGRRPSDPEKAALASMPDARQALALTLASPAFQEC